MQNHASRFPLNEVRIEIFRAHFFGFTMQKANRYLNRWCVSRRQSILLLQNGRSHQIASKVEVFKASLKEVFVVTLQFACKSASVPARSECRPNFASQMAGCFCTRSINIALSSLFNLLGPHLAIAALLQYLLNMVKGRRNKEIISNSGIKASSSRKKG